MYLFIIFTTIIKLYQTIKGNFSLVLEVVEKKSLLN